MERLDTSTDRMDLRRRHRLRPRGCTAVGRKGLLCTLHAQLSKGTLTAQGLLPHRAHDTPIAITSGTGTYNGARGTPS
jgi:hypothetical protein